MPVGAHVPQQSSHDQLGERAVGARPADASLEITSVIAGELVRLRGRLDVHAAADARAALAVAVTAGSGDLVVDLAGLDAVDATGLGVLVGVHRRASRASRTLVLRDVPPAIARLLFLTRLDRVLRLERSVRCA